MSDNTRRIASTAWSELGDEFNSLALKLQYHMEQELTDDESAEQDLESIVERMGERLEDTFEALVHASKDEAVREDARRIGRTLTDAMRATVQEIRTS